MEIRLENYQENGDTKTVLIDLPDPSSPINILEKARKYAKAYLDTSSSWYVFQNNEYIGDASTETIYKITSNSVVEYSTIKKPDDKTIFSTKEEAEEKLARIRPIAEKRLDFIIESFNEMRSKLKFDIDDIYCCEDIIPEFIITIEGCEFKRAIY